MLSEASSVQSPTVSIRRRTCVVCGSSTLNSYVTSFTRVPDKQEQWVTVLANGDAGFEDQLKASLATGRKYICYDHFDRQYFAQRKTDDGFELIRNRNPMAFVSYSFTGIF
ncbi:THAP-type domain-containing protein [Caenorhabditis elegans]|uniref:THAP-type domain-containing protein n=1 Tax=Caenorhabditis elegans TaxID=6239 RepID=H1UBJ4_CAEEL|nr:THAP-type domain-containing protein [Caenorhabditis elegans]CCF23346.1 THAP-type domain-containing protein [Caenorhabditis elegans]|eukprot:NP_001256618.1 Uncharacterized protein CELE_Y50E8A.12 [Caenorhabditis elegans]